MILLMLDEERTMKLTRNKDGEMVSLSEETAAFILRYCFECMSDAEFKEAFTRKQYELSRFEEGKC